MDRSSQKCYKIFRDRLFRAPHIRDRFNLLCQKHKQKQRNERKAVGISPELKLKQPPELCCKKRCLEISQNSQENTCARVSFLIKLKGLKQYNYKYVYVTRVCVSGSLIRAPISSQISTLTLSRRKSQSYRHQPVHLLCK